VSDIEDEKPNAAYIEAMMQLVRDNETKAMFKRVPREPTKEMLDAALKWSARKYGRPIGNDDATGCWQAMLDVATIEEWL
jgi:hypothetical protein